MNNIKKLIIDYIPLANKIAFQYFKKTPKKIFFEEIKSFAYLGLTDAANKYDPQKGSFSNYAKIRISGSIKDNLKELIKIDRIENSEQDVFEEKISFTKFNIEVFDFFDLICQKINNDIDKSIIKMYFIENKTMKEIGIVNEISESRVSQILKKSLKQIKSKFSKEDLIEII